MTLLNEQVFHQAFGCGKVTAFDGRYLWVIFDVGQKQFVYPDAFDTFLSIENPTLSKAIQQDLANVKQKKARADQTLYINTPIPAKKRKTSNTPLRSNIAFKCTYCDGGQSDQQIGFHGACSDRTIHNNIAVEHRIWCTADEAPCMQYYNGALSRRQLDSMCTGDGFICYESQMLRDWKAMAGIVRNGERQGKPMKLNKVQINSLCVLTTRDPDSSEPERYVFAVFLVDESYEGDRDETGYVSTLSKYKLKLSPKEARAILFWNYHANDNQPELPAWGSGLHRYLDDVQSALILRDIVKIKIGTADEALAKEFYEYYCKINAVNDVSHKKPYGALNLNRH